MPPAMTKPLDEESRKVLLTLTKYPASQLSILVLQEPQLIKFLSATLSRLSNRILELDQLASDEESITCLLEILEHAANSPDPSLPKRILASTESIINFAILAANTSARQTRVLSGRIRRIFIKLVDPVSAENYLQITLQSFQQVLKDGSSKSHKRAARILAALLNMLPVATISQSQVRTYEQQSKVDSQLMATSLVAAHQSIDVAWNGTQAAAAKLALLDASAALLNRIVRSKDKVSLAHVLLAFDRSSGRSDASQGLVKQAVKALVDASILVDLTLASPRLVDSINNSLAGKVSVPDDEKVRKQALEIMEQAHETAKYSRSQSQGSQTSLAGIGSTWADLVEHYKQLSLKQAHTRAKGKAREETQANIEPSPSLVAMVEAILPDLANDPSRLKRILSRRTFIGKGDEEIIQLLLDDQASESEDESEEELQQRLASTSAFDDPVATSNIYQPAASGSHTPVRVNIFDDQPLDASRLKWAGQQQTNGQEEGSDQNMSASLKASILARVQAQDAEEAAAGQEWNPFADEQREAEGREVGFEEELEDEDDRINRRFAISNLGGERGNAGDWRKRLEDYEDTPDDTDEAEGEHGTDSSRPQSRIDLNNSSTASVSVERAAERIFILAYSHQGSQLFSKDQTTRKSPARKALKAQLESATGKAYDDNLIESWGTMFERNPRKETLLNSASSYDMMSGGNQNLRSSSDQNSSEKKYGPDRGRGGRVLRGEQRGGGRGGSAGRGGGSASGGSNRGGHSGNDRGAKRKEQRGNTARTRGADRKQRAMGGPGAGV
ncbi:unnamed protein product [Sympodiomycopsis kandeliae]